MEVEVVGGIPGAQATTPFLLFALFTMSAGPVHSDPEIERHLNFAGHPPGKIRRILRVPLDIAQQYAGVTLSPNFTGWAAEDEYHKFKKGEWGKDRDLLCEWIREEVFMQHIALNLDKWAESSRSLIVVKKCYQLRSSSG